MGPKTGYGSPRDEILATPLAQTKCHISEIRAGMCLGPEYRPIAMFAMQRSAGLGSVPVIQPVHHIICTENALINRHGNFFESRIRRCPESVGVGKFCRLRLRLRAKQPTPTPTPQPWLLQW